MADYLDKGVRNTLINRHLVELKDDLRLDNELLDMLMQEGVIRRRDKVHIERPNATRDEKVDYLLDHLRSCDKWQYEKFLEILSILQRDLAALLKVSLQQAMPEPPRDIPDGDGVNNDDDPPSYVS